MNAVFEQERDPPKNPKTILNLVSLRMTVKLVLHTTFLSVFVMYLLSRISNTRNIYLNVNLNWLYDPGQT